MTVISIGNDTKSPTSSHSFAGVVDRFDPTIGLEGWAVNVENPTWPVELELVVGGMVVSRHSTDIERQDVAALFSHRTLNAGFRTGPEVFESLLAFSAHNPDAGFELRIRETTLKLRKGDNLPRLSDIVQMFDESGSGFNELERLMTRLASLQSHAAVMLNLPLRPRPDERRGFVEAFYRDHLGRGIIWIIGWIEYPLLGESAAVVVEGRKFASAAVIAHYARGDLPPNARGFVAAVRTDWQPVPAARPIIYFGDNGEFHIAATDSTRLMSYGDFSGHIDWARQHATGGGWSEIASLLNAPDDWGASRQIPRHIKAAIDQLLIIPNYGCFMTGWVVNLLDELRHMKLKLAEQPLDMDPGSLRLIARPDLRDVFPNIDPLPQKAGFCAFFPGMDGLQLSDDPKVQFQFQNSSVVMSIETEKIRMLGHSAELDRVFQFYPSIEHESFFEGFASALRLSYVRSARRLEVSAINKAHSAIIFVIPDAKSDRNLLFDQLVRNLSAGTARDLGIVFIAREAEKGRDIASLFCQISERLACPCSLIFSSDPTGAVLALGDVLMLTGVDRFLYVGEDVFLSQAAWAACRTDDLLDGELRFFDLREPDTDLSTPGDARCFAWNRIDFETWIRHAPILFGADFSREDFPETSTPAFEAGGFIARKLRSTRLQRLLNGASRSTPSVRALRSVPAVQRSV